MFRAPLYICFLYTVYIGCERVAALDRRLYTVMSRIKAIERELAGGSYSPPCAADDSGEPCLARSESTNCAAQSDDLDDGSEKAGHSDDPAADLDPGTEAPSDEPDTNTKPPGEDTSDEPIAEDGRSDDEDVEIVDE